MVVSSRESNSPGAVLAARPYYGRAVTVVEFARALMAWWPLAEERISAIASWPLVAVALAYAHCTHGFRAHSRVERWAEKTPTNERFLGRLRSEFPRAKLIHVVRHPFAVYASYKYEKQQVGQMIRNTK